MSREFQLQLLMANNNAGFSFAFSRRGSFKIKHSCVKENCDHGYIAELASLPSPGSSMISLVGEP